MHTTGLTSQALCRPAMRRLFATASRPAILSAATSLRTRPQLHRLAPPNTVPVSSQRSWESSAAPTTTPKPGSEEKESGHIAVSSNESVLFFDSEPSKEVQNALLLADLVNNRPIPSEAQQLARLAMANRPRPHRPRSPLRELLPWRHGSYPPCQVIHSR